ncbi:hypothetical protein LOZ65_001248 [Ophidiomyces ophidiicola]|nr:hypothetical protein LOZ65_001248 [Ophidiomyces ophidiicola]
MNTFFLHSIVGLWCFVLLTFSSAPPIVFPQPDGPFQVKYREYELVDTSRLDPFNTTHLRRLMVSRFDPVPRQSCREVCKVQYLPTRTARILEEKFLATVKFPRGYLEEAKLQVCCKYGHFPHAKSFPLLVFSPGFGGTRLGYAGIIQRIASKGYTVVSVDHPYDALAVEFPDGTLIPSQDIQDFNRAVKVRVADMLFVIDSLTRTNSPLHRRQPVGIFGHSLGGNTAAGVMYKDPKIAGGVNLDGGIYDDESIRGFGSNKTRQSFLLWGAIGHNQTNDKSWTDFWIAMNTPPHDAVWKKELSLTKTVHLTFSDIPEIVDLGKLRDQVGDVFGAIEGERNAQILGAYISGFFDFSLLGKPEGLLKGPSDIYPEVLFL